MLEFRIPAQTAWDSVKEEFVTVQETDLKLESSLCALSKWESIWKKPFLNTKGLSYEESISYIKCMTLNDNVDPNVYRFIDKKMFEQIVEYMNDSMTATVISKPVGEKSYGRSSQFYTSELIYYYMFTLGIPIECEKWHLNRLFILMEIYEAKNSPQQKISESQTVQNYAALNKARRAKLKSKG